MNTKRSFYNILFGIIGQAVTIILGIIIPRIFLLEYGSEANGILSSVSQVLVYLGLLEAGVGVASTQSLYKPVAEKNRDGISAIVNATDKYYKKIGTLYFLGVLFLSLVFPFLADSEMAKPKIMLIVFISSLSGVISFFFQGKYIILLNSEGKQYVITVLSTVISILISITKILLIFAGVDIILLQLMYFSFNIVQMLFVMLYVKRKYPWLDKSVPPDFVALKNRGYALVHQITGMVFSNTDTLILTVFCGFRQVSVYAMYTMLFGMIGTVITTLTHSVTAALGQAFNSDRAYYLKLHDAYEQVTITMTASLYCVACFFMEPFLRLYTAGVTDISYIDPYLPYLFAATFLLTKGRTASNNCINYAQHFKQTRWRAIAEAIINLTVSVAAVNLIGIYGVLIGTVAALLYRSNDIIIYANRRILGRSPKKTYIVWVSNILMFIGFSFLYRLPPIALTSYVTVILWAAAYTAVTVAVFFGAEYLIDPSGFRLMINIVKPMLQRRAAVPAKTD